MTTPPYDVDAGPEGPAVGAFFDLDGTLVAGYTAAAQTKDRLRRRDLRVAEFLTIAELAVEFRLGRRAFETLIEGSARTVKGRTARDVDESGERIFREVVADLIYPEMRELVRAHQRRGHTVVLSSSALTNQVAPVARYLGIKYTVCNRLVADEQGVLTGEIEQPVVWGPTKASGVQQFAADRGQRVDLPGWPAVLGRLGGSGDRSGLLEPLQRRVQRVVVQRDAHRALNPFAQLITVGGASVEVPQHEDLHIRHSSSMT